MVRYGMGIDLDRCQGCQSCAIACKEENNTGKEMYWMWVFKSESGSGPEAHMDFMPRPCQHCEDAPCAHVCPVGARFKHEDGFVLTDFERCIGCRYCEVACPYGVNSFNWFDPKTTGYFRYDREEGKDIFGAGSVAGETGSRQAPNLNPDHAKKIDGRLVSGGGHFKGVMEKCTFCVHRVKKGLKPACVANCPVRALTFGDLDDPGSELSLKLGERKSWKLLEGLGTGPKVHYFGGRPPSTEMKLWKKGMEG